MCSRGDDEDDDDEIQENKKNLNPQIDNAETEFMDTQPSPLLLQGYESYDDAVTLEDAETQGVCLAGETQALCYDGETEAVDDVDCAEDLCTQLFDDHDTEVVVDVDDEGAKRNGVLDDTEALSDVDCVERVDNHTVVQDIMLQTCLQKQDDGDFKEVENTEECDTAPVLEGFTSLRVASIRSSGLAARNMSLRRTNNTSYYSMSSSQHEVESSGPSVIDSSLKVLGLIDQRHSLEELDDKIKGSSSENKCRVGKSAVRKLLYEDMSHEEGLDINTNNTDKEENFPPVCNSDMELAGLSYVDSQEPGEASQTIALDFVDQFLKVNVTELDQEAEIIRSTGGKLKPLPGARGTQFLAKRANRIGSASGGTFDWDDYQEDGGGQFLRKEKGAFSNDGRRAHQSLPKSQDLKHLNPNNCWSVKENGEKGEQHDLCNSVAGLFDSDSKLLLHKTKKIDESMKVAGKFIGQNLIKKLNDARDGMVETGTQKDNPDMLDIGVDTQLAADAMEALCNGVGLNDEENNVTNQGAEIHFLSNEKGNFLRTLVSDRDFVQKRASRSPGSALTTRQTNQTKRYGTGLTKGFSILSEQQSRKARKQCDETEDMCNLHCELVEKSMNEKELERGVIGENERCVVSAPSGKKTVKKGCVQEQLNTYLPIACRTRQKASTQTQRDTKTSTILVKGIDNLSAPIAPKRKRSRAAINTLARKNCTEFKFIQPAHPKKTKVTHTEPSDLKICGTGTIQKGNVHPKPSKEEINGMSNSKIKFTQMKSGIKRKILASGQSQKELVEDTTVDHSPNHHSAIGTSEDSAVIKAQTAEYTIGKSRSAITAAEGAKLNPWSKESLKDICTPKSSAYVTPNIYTKSVNKASPVGKEYHKPSFRKKPLSSPLKKEDSRIIEDGPESAYTYKELRKRRDITKVQVLFSQHLDGDVIKQQKKVLFRLGASVASSVSDATHFVADEFVRTRNMLEAIAFGKPVVTHFWLESCGQASCLIDERNYILRDAKKEKEIGFSLPVSLARACQHPLLQGCRVFITPNTKPGKDILASLVKAVHGVAVDRIGRSAAKDEMVSSDWIVLSCEEDYADCVPFLEKGASIYSSELLLNGIVIQKLEHKRHQLFAEIRKDGNEFNLLSAPFLAQTYT
nr:PREDICTED: uncharacterized protein LOC108196552 isoform X1 [Daucus carota subsp. sativus]